jgi:crotonobetainyl-CoA:carnitine CoA-transferase CaiB-like acyl-CoA transferase
MEQMGAAIVFDGAPAAAPSPAPLPGQHTDAICRELGFDDIEIARLRASGAIA